MKKLILACLTTFFIGVGVTVYFLRNVQHTSQNEPTAVFFSQSTGNHESIYLKTEKDTFKIAVKYPNFTLVGRKWIIKHENPLNLKWYNEELTNEQKKVLLNIWKNEKKY